MAAKGVPGVWAPGRMHAGAAATLATAAPALPPDGGWPLRARMTGYCFVKVKILGVSS